MENETPKEAGPTAQAVLTVTLYTDGRIHVTGPLDNKLACYGMLELARDAVASYEKQASKLVLAPSMGGLRTGQA